MTTYDAQDRLEQYETAVDGVVAYTYTANGELATKTDASGTTTYAYDASGNLRAVVLDDGGPTEKTIEYRVDGRNRRIGKLVDGMFQQGFLYQDQLKPVAELGPSGTVVAEFVYGSKLHIPDYLIRYDEQSGQPTGTYRILSDHIGSPRLVLDVANGAVVQRLDYDEFGNVLSDSNLGLQPFGFAGGIYDRDTGLVRFGARDYEPEVGRWTAKDPVGYFGGANYYIYSGSDPVNLIDPTGTYPIPPGGRWCGSSYQNPGITVPVPPQGSGNPELIRQAYDHVSEQVSRGCDASGPHPPVGESYNGLRGGIDETQGYQAWYLPSGDPVVDYARCVHETQHLTDSRQHGGDWSQEEYEDSGYRAQQDFLSRYLTPK